MNNFGKRALALMLALLLFAVLLPGALAESYPFSGFATDSVRMRKGASATAEVMLTVPQGDGVYVTGEKSGYFIVQYEGKQGYILKAYVSKTAPQQGASATQKPASDDAKRNYEDLNTGKTGAKVRALQQALAELGFYAGTVDSSYGKGTFSAVQAFQKMNGLTVTGIADATTQEMLYEKTVKNSKGRKATVRTLPPIEGYEMRLNDKGDAVITLKIRLQELGYYQATSGDKFDTTTKNALIAFQKKNGLLADGVAGVKTQNVLFSSDALYKNQTATPLPTMTIAPSTTPLAATYPYQTTVNASVILRKTASISGARLTTIPKNAAVSVLAVNDDFLKVSYKTYTGYVVSAYVDIPSQYLGSEFSEYSALKSGDSGELVRALQQALKELKFYNGVIDGKFSNTTVSAVKAFQARNGYVQTGVMSASQQKMLYEGRPKNASGTANSIKTLPPIEGYPMAQGDQGDAVEKLQTALKKLGYYAGAISGKYDSATAAAVKKFQKAKGLTADGKAGGKTQAILFALTITPTPVPDNIVTTAPQTTQLTSDNVIVMQNGTRGVAVKNLQQRLIELGYYTCAIDGIYDSNDIAAVRAFQRKNNLNADGIAGLETQILLFSENALPYATATPIPNVSTPTPTPKPVATATPDVSTLLKTGSKGVAVAQMQSRLKELNYFSGEPDGLYGTATATAVRLFQRQNGLDIDGMAGTKTLKAIYSSSAKKYSLTTATATPAAVETVLKLGDSGTAVKAVQTRLIELGYMKKADGAFGPATYAAVLAFQQKNGLTVDGTVGKTTLTKLQSASAKKADAAGTVTPTPKPNNSTGFTAPKASEVRYANWYTEIRTRARALPNVTIYDPDTGLHYKLHMFSFGKHADAEPPTAEDTAIMYQVCGTNSWTAHAVWVIFEDGRVYMASTHSHGHTVDHTANNNLTGHICLHFPRLMEEAEATGPYAVSHQKAILLGWELTQAMIK